MTATPRAAELALAAAQAAADKLARDIVVIDVSDRLAITDCFVIASAENERQVKAAVDEIEERLRGLDAKPVRREGEREGRWVLLDFIDIVVHVQIGEERAYYGLERLWKDCPAIPFIDRDAARTAAAISTGAGSPTAPGRQSTSAYSAAAATHHVGVAAPTSGVTTSVGGTAAPSGAPSEGGTSTPDGTAAAAMTAAATTAAASAAATATFAADGTATAG